MLLKEILDEIFKEEYSYTLTDLGLSNDIYLLETKCERFIVHVSKQDLSRFLNPQIERAVQLAVLPLNIDFKEYHYDPSAHIRITYFEEDLKEFKDSEDENKYYKAIDLIHKFHSLDFKCDHRFDLVKMYEGFKSEIKKELIDYKDYQSILDRYNHLEYQEVLSHNDLVSGNILFGKQDYLIDYEYAAMNHPYFDLMSFITENQINDPLLREKIFQYYFKRALNEEDRQTLKTIEDAQNLLWAAWANMLYDSRHEDVYLEIFYDKIKHL